MNKLTLKQRRFADEYIISGNATQAAIKAGYAEKTARTIAVEILTKPNIKNYISERLSELESNKIATQEEVLKYLTSIMRGEQTEKTLRSMGESGQELIDIDVGAKDRIRAAELLGKRFGMWVDKKEQRERIKSMELENKRRELMLGTTDNEEAYNDGFIEALKGTVEETWQEE